MTTAEFRKWIEAGLKDYGEDPWFFLRELAQNSRDAGAKTISVKAGHTAENDEILIFEDDGHGMSYAHAVQYLFRLYASSKLRQKHSAGMFGIGFWTVLKYKPQKLLIESRIKKEKWGVLVDAELNTTRILSDLPRRGTRITLIRPAGETPRATFVGRVEEALISNCSYLRRNTRNFDPLPVLFRGKNITAPMKLPGPVSLSFKKPQVEGAVGLAPHPRVYLYARGLPVWQGTTLEELSHTPPTRGPQRNREMAEGLAPVFLINGSSLEVNISRRKVIDNRALQRLRKTAENALAQLVELAADSVSPRNALTRIRDRLKKTFISIFRSFWKSLLVSLLLILPLEYALLTIFNAPPPKTPANYPAATRSMQLENNRYSGASVGPVSSPDAVDISYSPPVTTWFKLYHAENYEPVQGFTQTFTDSERVTFPTMYCDEDMVTIQWNNPEKGTLLLPQPTGFFLDPAGLTLDNRLLPFAEYYTTGGILVNVPRGGVLRYRCCLPEKGEAPSPESFQRLIQLPRGMGFPDSIRTELDKSMNIPVDKKVDRAVQLTASLLFYNDSEETAAKYADSTGKADWFGRALEIGAGDCDILNGVTILLLRKMGIPSRLVIGLVGESGRVLPGMHAWIEYFEAETGWRSLDATAYIGASVSPPSSTSPTSSTSTTSTTSTTSSRGTGEVVRMPPMFHRLSETPVKAADPREVSPVPLPAEPAIKTGTGNGFSLYNPLFLSFASILLLLFFFLVLVKIKPKERFFADREIPQVEENLAGMALHALLHPQAWGDDSNIRNVAIIPTILGVPISLRRALTLSKAGKLFFIGKTNPLADHLKKSSVPILQGGHAAFDPLIKALPEAVNLDHITGLRAVPPGASASADLLVGELLTAVNRLVSPPCLTAPGLEKEAFADVDLSPLPPSYLRRMGLPARFIAVNPNNGNVKILAALFEKNPQLAQFQLVKALLKESVLIPGPADRIIHRVSLRLSKGPA